MTALQRSALVSQVIDSLQDNIRNGTWPVGSRIPVEAELAAQIGVSRVTLRQAVQALVHVGVLQTIQGNGTFVRAITELDAVLKRYVAGEDLRAVVEVRLAIESESAYLAARRHNEDDVARLDQIIATSRKALTDGDVESLANLSVRFHHTVVQAAHNTVLEHFYQALHEGTERSIREDAELQQFTTFVDEHAQLVSAIKQGLSDEAHDLARSHLLPLIASTPDH